MLNLCKIFSIIIRNFSLFSSFPYNFSFHIPIFILHFPYRYLQAKVLNFLTFHNGQIHVFLLATLGALKMPVTLATSSTIERDQVEWTHVYCRACSAVLYIYCSSLVQVCGELRRDHFERRGVQNL